MRGPQRLRETSDVRTRGLLVAALGLVSAIAANSCSEASMPEANGPPGAWGPVGDTQRAGVVRLVAADNTANLEIVLYRRVPGAQHVACDRYVSLPAKPFILGASVWPVDQHKPFPALTLTFRSRGAVAQLTESPAGPIDGPCRAAQAIHLRGLDAKEQAAFLGVQPSPRLPQSIEVVVNGHSASVPMRPICEHGEKQSVSGCVYDPVTWDDQPGFPSINL
jgi:hypothetical protein